MKKISTKAIAFYGIMAAFSLVLGYIEHLIPLPIGIYCIKLGLANLATVVSLYFLGAPAALTLNFIRIILSSLLFGNVLSLSYSLCGGMLSCLIMIAVKHIRGFSCVGVSICGGVAHNIAQLAVAVILLDNVKIAFYLPVLVIVGAITGLLIGLCALPLVKNKYLRSSYGISE